MEVYRGRWRGTTGQARVRPASTSRPRRCAVIALRTSTAAMPLSWPEAVRAAEQHTLRGVPLTEISDDSRTVRPGAIFVAHRGRQVDGHAFIGAALAAGARMVVAEQPVECEAPLCVVPDGRRGLSALAAAWFGHPARQLRMVGVTGTNGKTTTVQLAAAILEAMGLHACRIGTLGVQGRGGGPAAMPWTTPSAIPLHAALAQEIAGGTDACVMEVSAQGLSQARVADCAFDVGAITNFARDHREFYRSEEEYVQAKATLFRQLRAGDKPATAVLNGAVRHLAVFREACGVPILEYGEGGAVRALSVRRQGLDGTRLVIRTPARPGGVLVQLHLAGAHNVDNALCAAAIGVALGASPEAIASGLQSVREVPGRLQHVSRGPVRTVVDYAHNPSGLRAVLRLLREATTGRLVVVMGARGQRDQGKRPLMGTIAAAFADQVVLTSDRPADEDPQAAAEPMRLAIADCGVPVRFVSDRLRALALAMEGRAAGDCVVALGKGQEPWEDDSEQAGWDDVAALEALQAEGGRAAAGSPLARAHPQPLRA